MSKNNNKNKKLVELNMISIELDGVYILNQSK